MVLAFALPFTNAIVKIASEVQGPVTLGLTGISGIMTAGHYMFGESGTGTRKIIHWVAGAGLGLGILNVIGYLS